MGRYGKGGTTENAGVEKAARSKCRSGKRGTRMPGWKMQEWKTPGMVMEDIACCFMESVNPVNYTVKLCVMLCSV